MIIAGSGGPISMSIPIIGSRSTKLPYNQIEIDYRSSWQRDHFRTLVTVYGNSPYFFLYRDELESLFTQKKVLLYEWNLNCLNWLFNKLKLDEQVVYKDSSLVNNQEKWHFMDKYTPVNFNSIESVIKYPQVFEDRIGFLPNLSTLDMLFNIGLDAGRRLTYFNLDEHQQEN